MFRFLGSLFATLIIVSAVGCAMCCAPFDYDYPTFGGITQRADPAYGRVGSVFSDPYVAAGFPAPTQSAPPESRNFDDDNDLDDLLDGDREEILTPSPAAQDPIEIIDTDMGRRRSPQGWR